jgi:hypothetical protein
MLNDHTNFHLTAGAKKYISTMIVNTAISAITPHTSDDLIGEYRLWGPEDLGVNNTCSIRLTGAPTIH